MASLAMAVAGFEAGGGAKSPPHLHLESFQRRVSARPSGMWKPGTALLHSGMRSKRIVNVAALPRNDDEQDDENEEEDENADDDPEEEDLKMTQSARDFLSNFMKEKVRGYRRKRQTPAPPKPEDKFFSTFVKLEPFFENEEPSEGMKQLLALVEASPAFQPEPPPKFIAPRWLTEGAIIGAFYAFCFLVAHVNAVLDVHYERKFLAEQAERAEKAKKYENSKLNQLKKRLRELIRMGFQYIEFWIQSSLFWAQSQWLELLNKWKGRFS